MQVRHVFLLMSLGLMLGTSWNPGSPDERVRDEAVAGDPDPHAQATTAPSTQPAGSMPQASEPLEYVEVTTNKGSFILELNHEKAPISVDNFLRYVDKQFYDNTTFHRIVKQSIYVLQGGGYDVEGQPKPTDKPIKNEWRNGLKNTRGSISMARTNVADSATSQFFINVKDDPMLDQPNDGAAYAVFGRVVAGMKTIDALYATPVTTRPGGRGEASLPMEPLFITQARRISAHDAQQRIASENDEASARAPASQPTSAPGSRQHPGS
jgi:peptidyl-prolyl cis-trans isomerase A (cyclophilin A)